MPRMARRFEGGLEQVAQLREWISRHAREAGVSEAELDGLQLALTEAYTNVLRHAYQGQFPAPLEVEFEVDAGAIVVIMRDEGKTYQPHSMDAPSPEEMAEGGYGLFLIQSLMDEVTYSPAGATGTVLTLKKLRRAIGGHRP